MNDVTTDKKIKDAIKKYCDEVNKYFKTGNIESSYNKPVIDLIQSFGCTAHDFSGQRSGDTGENIDINLVQTELICKQVFLFHLIDVEAELNVLLLDHRLGNRDKVLHRFYNGEGKRTQLQLAAFHL